MVHISAVVPFMYIYVLSLCASLFYSRLVILIDDNH